MSVVRTSQTPSVTPVWRLVFTIAAIILASLGLFLSACTRSVSTEVFITPTIGAAQTAEEKAAQVIIENVQVTQGEGIYVTGRASLANGECVQTRLLVDGSAAAWWPKDVCVQVDSGRWEFLASLNRNGAPVQLSSSSSYVLQAWSPKQEQATLAQFPLNLNGPKQP